MRNLNQSIPLPMHYFLRVPNFGDRLNPILAAKLTGCEPYWVSDTRVAHMIAIGSLMAAATPQSHVWGTGVMHPDLGVGEANRDRVFALRGPLSYMALRQTGLDLRDIPMGDPAILAPHIFGIAPRPAPRHRIGLVAHYVDRQRPSIRKLLNDDGVADINVHRDPLAIINDMADCDLIVSSSLHGLIIAEALGLPSLWITAGDDIAGGCFKFDDWFATTRNPQALPHVLGPRDSVDSLAAMAERREHTIDLDALIAALPVVSPGTELTALPSKPRRQKSVADCRAAPIPIFLISFNRGLMLQQVVSGLRSLASRIDIIVHDNGSDDPRTLEILDELDNEGVTIYRYRSIENANQLNQVNDSVSRYFEDWSEPCAYAVSDCDVDISIAAPDVLEVFRALLNHFRKAECVGPMLRIRDIPEDYPLRNRALNRHIDQFWRHKPILAELDGRPFAYQDALIDTTFALHRPGETFRRLKSGVRVYEPFEALHLDWYLSAAKGPQDQTYAVTSYPLISHWNNHAETQAHEGAPLEFDHYYYVQAASPALLRVCKQVLTPLNEAGPIAKGVNTALTPPATGTKRGHTE